MSANRKWASSSSWFTDACVSVKRPTWLPLVDRSFSYLPMTIDQWSVSLVAISLASHRQVDGSMHEWTGQDTATVAVAKANCQTDLRLFTRFRPERDANW